VTLIEHHADHTLYKRARVVGDADAEWEGNASLYDPPVGEDPTPFLCVYEPDYFDKGRDYAATGNGRVLTVMPFSTGDLVVTQLDPEVTQEVTRANPKYRWGDIIDFYEVYL